MRELGLEQRLAQRDAAMRAGDDHQHQRLDEHPEDHRLEIGVATGGVSPAGGDHAVDDARAHPGHGGRQHAGEQGHEAEEQGQLRAGGPHQLQGALAVAEYAEEAARRIRRVRGDFGRFGEAGLGAHLGGEAYRESLPRKASASGDRCDEPFGAAQDDGAGNAR